MSDNKHELIVEFENDLQTVKDTAALENIRVKYLGKKGKVTEQLKNMKDLSPEERKTFGSVINKVKLEIQSKIDDLKSNLERKEQDEALRKDTIDTSLPGTFAELGTFHPVTLIAQRISELFIKLGYFITDGPEIEEEYYNFEALNVPAHHPARDMQDTFYLENGRLLRTQTSPMQIRVMETIKPPIKMITFGKVYRVDNDITHSPMFHQMEGLAVDKNVSMSDLKGTLGVFVKEIFGKIPYRFRASYFPFTEPSAEVDIQCIFCKGKGCNVCSNSGWIEILGCGMVNPKVFESVNYEPGKYTGLAFGLGIERIAMLAYGINDIRLLYNSDIRFLKQLQ
ncbi:MAG: phenylalanine--tRNA ligase subunit alpha [Candidatus Riflebacteria bacterium]|nr:phenylalanine--tRNA ligase subunit alpha [Candidatus Riflebacteria bacterium]